eukprot:TCONS_00072069-protein
MADKEEKVYLARLAEQAERYEEMVEYMTSIAKMDVGLTQEERNLLSVAFKNVIGARRASWRIVSSIEESRKDTEESALATDYRKKIETELQRICNEILDLLEKHLIPSSTVEGDSTSAASNTEQKEAHVFYYKMQGDYLRYKAEFTAGNDKKEAAEASLLAYKTASDAAATNLQPTHPIRLGLALNFSVFYYEILNAPDRACKLAKKSFDEAVAELDGLPEESYKDSTLIMQLLRDNLTLWTSEISGGEG